MLKLLKSATAVSLVAIMVACSTSWVTEAVNILKVVTPAAVNILTLVAALEGKPINAQQVMTVTNDINAAITELQSYTSASVAAQPGVLAQLNAALATTQKDLGAILTDLRISDPVKVAQVTALVTFVISEVAAVQSLLPGAPVAAQRLPVSAKQFRNGFNAIMKSTAPALAIK